MHRVANTPFAKRKGVAQPTPLRTVPTILICAVGQTEYAWYEWPRAARTTAVDIGTTLWRFAEYAGTRLAGDPSAR